MSGVCFISIRGTRGRGIRTVIDMDSFRCHGLAHAKMYCDKKGYVCFANPVHGRSDLKLHRVVSGAARGELVDHANRCRLDNRKRNLRICNPTQNQANRAANKSKAGGIKGVYRRGNRWRAMIGVGRSTKHIGYFTTREDAAMAYNEVARSMHGEFAFLNPIKEAV